MEFQLISVACLHQTLHECQELIIHKEDEDQN